LIIQQSLIGIPHKFRLSKYHYGHSGGELYLEAKARVVRALGQVTLFAKTTNNYLTNLTSSSNRAKVETMILELQTIRTNVYNDIKIMEHAVSSNSAPPEVVDHSNSISYVGFFDQMYYNLMAMAKFHKMTLYSTSDTSLVTNITQFRLSNNQSFYQLPKRKFPTFSSDTTEWQGFEDLFTSILSHTPGHSDLDKFEYLKTSLEGEELSLVAHLNLTSNNYNSTWDILRGCRQMIYTITKLPTLDSHKYR